MFERFTDRARRVLVLAQEEARLLNHSFMGTEHILLGLIGEREGIAAEALRRCGITLEATRAAVEEIVGAAGEPPSGSPPFTPRAKKVLELSLREAMQRGHNYIGTEHLLLGIIREGEGVAAVVIQNLGVSLINLATETDHVISGSSEGHESAVPGDETEGSPTHADPPRCSRCRAGLADAARYKVIEVPSDELQAGEAAVSVTVIYCGRCGVALGIV